jgi:cytochrome c553
MNRSVLLAAAPLALAMLAATSSPALSQTPAAATAASTCAACHGPAGISGAPTTPNLAGQKAGYLEGQLKAFKAKSRTNAFMNPIAGQLSDDDIHALAAYWASLPAAPAAAPTQSASIASAATLPAGFPTGFTLYQDKPGADGGKTRRYANAVALKATQAKQALPIGSAIVTVSLDKDGAVTAYETMESRTGWGAALPPLLRNGDFQYGRFDKAGKQVANFNQAPCLACHKGKEADSFMFTRQVLMDAKG